MRLSQLAFLMLAVVCFTSCESVNYDLHTTNNEFDYDETFIKEISDESVNFFEEDESESSVYSTEESTYEEQSLADNIKTIEGLDGSVVDIDLGHVDSMAQSIMFENFTYYRDATGLSFNDKSYLEMDNIWHRLNIGDIFGTLTVSSAYSKYITNGKEYENAANLSEEDADWCERGVRFDGTVILEGIISANLNENAYWANALFFQADPESLKEQDFPLLKSIAFSWARDIYPYGTDNDMVEDTEVFYLGSVEQYNNIIPFQNYANSDGLLNIYVKVELSDINLQYHIGTGSTPCGENTAILCSMSLI